jgi:tetratricopeptide (TPR) repeat protein
MFDRAIQLDPISPEAYFLRGRLMESLGNQDQASSDYKKALSFNPDLKQAKEAQNELTKKTVSAQPAAKVETPVKPSGRLNQVALVIGNSNYVRVPNRFRFIVRSFLEGQTLVQSGSNGGGNVTGDHYLYLPSIYLEQGVRPERGERDRGKGGHRFSVLVVLIFQISNQAIGVGQTLLRQRQAYLLLPINQSLYFPVATVA